MPYTFQLPKEFYTEVGKDLLETYMKTREEAERQAGYNMEFLTIEQACRFVSVSKNTFRTNFLEQGLSAYKVGNKTYIKKKELSEFITKHRL